MLKGRGLKWARVAVALTAFVGMNLFLLGVAGGCGWLAKIQLLPALLAGNALVVALWGVVTFLYGRVYCSVICPLGVLQDMLNRLLPRKARTWQVPSGRVRLTLLVVCVVLGTFGAASLAALFDGYSLYGRFVTNLFKPVWQAMNNLCGWICAEQGHPCLFREEVFVRGLCGCVVAGTGLVLVIACVLKGGRFFCNLLCPTGTLLACVSKHALLRVRIDAKRCVRCGLCERACKANCIDAKGGVVDDARCIRCFNCLDVCRKGAIEWK